MSGNPPDTEAPMPSTPSITQPTGCVIREQLAALEPWAAQDAATAAVAHHYPDGSLPPEATAVLVRALAVCRSGALRISAVLEDAPHGWDADGLALDARLFGLGVTCRDDRLAQMALEDLLDELAQLLPQARRHSVIARRAADELVIEGCRSLFARANRELAALRIQAAA